MSESNRHTLTITESAGLQLTILSGPAGTDGADGAAGATGAAGPSTITSATGSDGLGNITLSNLTTTSFTSSNGTFNGSLTMAGDVLFADNVKASFGNADLEIYHHPTGGSFIKESGTGSLSIQGDSTINITKTDGEVMATFGPDGSANLYYDNAVKLATTALGITTSSIYIDGAGDITALTGRVKLGSTSQLQIYHDATNAYIANGTGSLLVNSDTAITGGVSVIGNTTLQAATITGAATLSGGAAITGDTSVASGHLSLGDATTTDGKIKLGTGGDLEIYHNGIESFVDGHGGFGNLRLRGTAGVFLQKYSGETFVTCVADGAVTLYHDNAVRFATTSTGATVAGNVTSTGNVISSGLIQHKVYTIQGGVDQIPAATGLAGTRAFVSDNANSLASHHGSTAAAGSGANFVPVFSDGTNWIVG